MKRVVLIGFALSYKSTVGQMLANKLGVSWYDTDLHIQRTTGVSVGDIISTKGEYALRRAELHALQTIPKDNCVLSCGGGVPLSAESMRLVVDNSIIVWLRTSADTVWQRLQHSKDNRPLHKGLDKGALNTFVNNRNQIYNQYQQLIVDTDNCTPFQVLDELIQRLQTLNVIK